MSYADLVGLPLADVPLVFFDLETTGLELGAGHRICEIAMLRVCGERVEGSLDTLVNPERLLDPEAAAVNQLTDAALALAPPFASVTDQVATLIDGAVLVAHNQPFDMAFLNAELRRIGLPEPANPSIDTLLLARRLLKQPSYSLAALAALFALPTPSHRAMTDVIALRALFERLAALMSDQGISTLRDVMRLERGLLPGAAEPAMPVPISQALNEGRLLRITYRSRSTPGPAQRLIRPLYISQEQRGVYLRAFCYLRNDVRTFALARIEQIEVVLDEG